MKRFKIISFRSNITDYEGGAIKVSNKDEADIKDMISLFKELTQKYCDIHNYDFVFKDITANDLMPIIENKKKYNVIFQENTDREIWNNISLYKILMTRNELLKNDSEYVVFFDSDMFVSNPNISLDEFIDDNYEFWMSQGNNRYDFPHLLNDLIKCINLVVNDKEIIEEIIFDKKNGLNLFKNKFNTNFIQTYKMFYFHLKAFNAACFIVKNTEDMKHFFNMLCDNFYIVNLNDSILANDEFLISTFINSSKIFNKAKYLPFSMIGHVLGIGEFKYDEERSFAQHNYACVSIKDRLNLARLIKQNKWWKGFLENEKI